MDVLPTLAGLANLNIRYEGPGVDLSAAVRGEEPAPELLAFSHSSVLPHYVERTMTHLRLFRSLFPRRDPELMWVAAREHDTVYKLRRLNGAGFTPAVFDLARDPTEASDLFDPKNPLHRKRVEQLANYRQSLVKGYEEWEETADALSESRQEELLRSLGYIE